MWDLNTKQLMYMSFYYFSNIFLVACIFYDLYNEAVTGFTFGYMFALLYMIARTREVLKLMVDQEKDL